MSRDTSGIRRARREIARCDADPEQANNWYEQAAERGDASAMLNLGIMIVGTDIVPARTWLERAADHGLAEAMFALADLLMQSDPISAQTWEDRAAATPAHRGLCAGEAALA